MRQRRQNFRELGSLNIGHNFRWRFVSDTTCVSSGVRGTVTSWDNWICSGFLARCMHCSEGTVNPWRMGQYLITKIPSAWQRTTHPAAIPAFKQKSPRTKPGVGSWRTWRLLGCWPKSLNFFPSRYTGGLDFPVPLEVRLGHATCFDQWNASNLAPWVTKMRRAYPIDP